MGVNKRERERERDAHERERWRRHVFLRWWGEDLIACVCVFGVEYNSHNKKGVRSFSIPIILYTMERRQRSKLQRAV